MARKILSVIVVVILAVALAGCATNGYYDPSSSAAAGALGGAATGAALGAIIGAATGSPATGAWVGAAAGAVAGGVGGYLYAEHRNSQARDAAAAARAYNYTPQETVVNIDKTEVVPARVRAGQQVNMVMNYTILTPGGEPVAATLVREVRLGGAGLGKPYETNVTNDNGSFADQVAYTLPSNATPGTYMVVSRLVTSLGAQESTAYFIVE